MNTVEVYGATINLPDTSKFKVENWGTDDPLEQYWRRIELPDFFEEVVFDKNGDLLLTEEQEKYAEEEIERCRNGFWFMNRGVPTYITGKNYFYLQWWKLEDDVYPNYRDADRRYFLFLDHWERVPWCLGVVRGKKRREGASSQACSNLIYECIFFKNSLCGIVSKSNDDAKDTFTDMVAFGYRQLPVFLQPKQLNSKDSVSEFVFAHKSKKVQEGKASVINQDAKHRSKINYKATKENSYDRGRLSRILGDEGGKWPKEERFSQFISKMSKCLVRGGVRVGFGEFPSTVNEMTRAGGKEYHVVWTSANQFEFRKTPNRLVRYFSPAYDGYEGFIDKYGMSVIDPPTEEQAKYLIDTYAGLGDLEEEDIMMGAKAYIFSRRKDLEGDMLEEEIRQNPTDERELFMSRNLGGHFDTLLLNELYHVAKTNEKEALEYGNWTWRDGVPFTESVWEPCAKEFARWTRPKNFKLPDGPKTEKRGILHIPLNTIQFIAGADPFQNSIVESGQGSKAASYIMNRYDPGINDPFFNKMLVSQYLARPKMVKLLHMDMILQCFAYGCMILIEAKMDGGMRDFFVDNGCEAFLIKLPGKGYYGGNPDNDTKALMVNLWEQYIYTHGKEGKLIYPDLIDEKDKRDGLYKFDIQDTEVSNRVMGGGWTLVADYYRSVNWEKQKQEKTKLKDIFKSYAVG